MIDAPRLQECSRIKNFIALAMIIAWRVMLMTYLPRQFPTAPCTIIFTPLEWRLAYLRAYKETRPLPEHTPTLKDAVMFVAILGGYQKRKQPPGIQTIWKGNARLMDMIYGHKLALKYEHILN